MATDRRGAEFETWLGLSRRSRFCFSPSLIALLPQEHRRPVHTPRSLNTTHSLHDPMMLNIFKIVRYIVFLLFVICNAIIISVAVSNLSIVQQNVLFNLASSRQIDGYLIFVGVSALLLIFPTIFLELLGKNVFLGKVWFELLWVGLFSVMELAGAAAVTAQNNSRLCGNMKAGIVIQVILPDSPCATTRVLQAFTWICAIFLLGYFLFLCSMSLLKHREDPTIWQYRVNSFPFKKGVNSLQSNPSTPTGSVFRAPTIAAPRPRRAANVRDPVLSYRSGDGLGYDVEASQPPPNIISVDRPMPPIPATTFSQPPQIRQLTEQAQQQQQPVFASPFYHSSVQTALGSQAGPKPQAPLPAQLTQVKRLPSSPPPLGDWPRLDATSRPRTKQKGLPPNSQHVPQPHQPSPVPVVAPSGSWYVGSSPTSVSPTSSKPGGPRRKPSEERRPPALDLSSISAYRSTGRR